MKSVRNSITEYESDISNAIDSLQLQSLGLETSQPGSNEIATETEVPPLTPPDNYKEEEIMDKTSVTSCGGTGHKSFFIIGNQVKEFSKVLGWFSGNIVGSSLYGQNNKQYTIRFTDGEK